MPVAPAVVPSRPTEGFLAFPEKDGDKGHGDGQAEPVGVDPGESQRAGLADADGLGGGDEFAVEGPVGGEELVSSGSDKGVDGIVGGGETGAGGEGDEGLVRLSGKRRGPIPGVAEETADDVAGTIVGGLGEDDGGTGGHT